MGKVFKGVFSGLSAVAFFFFSTVAFAAQWQIIESSGTVRTTSPVAGATLVSTGNTLNAGDILSTGFDGRVVLARNEQQIVVGPNSRMSLPAAEEPGMTRILQDIGTLLFKVDKRQEKHFRVETPVIAAVVKGTTFTVTAGAEADAVHVAEGAVEVSVRNSAVSELVTSGRTVRIDRNNPSAIRFTDTVRPENRRETDDRVEGDASKREAALETQTTAPGGATALTVPAAIGVAPLDFATLTDGLVQSPQGNGPTAGLSRAAAATPTNAAVNARLSATNNANANNANTARASAAAGNANGGASANSNAGNGNANGGVNANGNAGNGNANGGVNANGNAGNGNANGGANANVNAGNGNANGGVNANGNAGNGNANGGVNANGNAGNGNANGGVNANGNAGNGNGNGGGNGTGNEGNGNENGNGGVEVNANVGGVEVNAGVNLNGGLGGLGVTGGINVGNGNGNGNGGGNEDNGKKEE